jgi:hypothetical protein
MHANKEGFCLTPLSGDRHGYTYAPSVKNKNNSFLDGKYTQSPIIRNGPIRLGVEFGGKFKKRALGRSNLRNALKNLGNAERSDFQS